jgi:hypothetical protein
MSPGAPSAQELTRRLVARAAGENGSADSVALAVHAACERTYRELTRSLGQTGSQALLARAVAQSEVAHPLLKDIRIGRQAKPEVDSVRAAVQAHGAGPVAAALEAVLVTLLELLARLIGDDMVARLVEPGTSTGTHEAGNAR